MRRDFLLAEGKRGGRPRRSQGSFPYRRTEGKPPAGRTKPEARRPPFRKRGRLGQYRTRPPDAAKRARAKRSAAFPASLFKLPLSPHGGYFFSKTPPGISIPRDPDKANRPSIIPKF
ncbi:hypothetical protein B4135_1171 [Caldibacillus debilis]|uniref:Uncharacterized protein n=1 Tax=Caldibacillus debilis TaxID=301148 RepID=A0A150ME56_9BACI|nr:hypothetical protein B4135_1171 [Caldibacillus debilis]